jgi:hypothetical protein
VSLSCDCILYCRVRRGLFRMVVGFTTTYVISAYHHWCCEFKSRSGRGVQHYVKKFVCDLRQVNGFLRVLRFPPPIKLTTRYNWNIVESGVTHHQTNKQTRYYMAKLCMYNLSPYFGIILGKVWHMINHKWKSVDDGQ